MDEMSYTHYTISFKNGERLHHIDNFNLKYDDILDKLMILNNRKRDDIKNVIVTYGYERFECR